MVLQPEKFNTIRLNLLEITKVDVLELQNEYTSLKKSTWKRDKYTCTKCGATWNDAKLARHHIIPRLVGWYLGLTRRQLDNPINTNILCEKCHQVLDRSIREYINKNFPEIWTKVKGAKLSKWWYG